MFCQIGAAIKLYKECHSDEKGWASTNARDKHVLPPSHIKCQLMLAILNMGWRE